jgi:LPXTG-site transpeptidase (sortase) family protein
MPQPPQFKTLRRRRFAYLLQLPQRATRWRTLIGWRTASYIAFIICTVLVLYIILQMVTIRMHQIATAVATVPTQQPTGVAQSEAISAENALPRRLQIPAIALDATIIPVGWYLNPATNETEWEVARYAVGHHQDSGRPGGGSNIVLSSHVAGYGRLFADLDKLHRGDRITIISDTGTHTYAVTNITYVASESANSAEHIANMALLDPTPNEQVTLITCWPARGEQRFTQRLIVVATPIP